MAITTCTVCKKKKETRKCGDSRFCYQCWKKSSPWFQERYPVWLDKKRSYEQAAKKRKSKGGKYG